MALESPFPCHMPASARTWIHAVVGLRLSSVMTVKIPGCDISRDSVWCQKLYGAPRKSVQRMKLRAVFRIECRTVRRCSPLPQASPPKHSGRSAGTGSSCVYAFAADACPHGRQAHSQWMPQPAAYTYHSSSLHRNACIFFKKTYSPTSRLVCLPQKRATWCCCGKFLLELRHAAEIFRGGEPAPQPKDFHDQRPRNPSDRDPKFRRTEPEAFQTQDPRLCPRKDGYCP